MTADISDDKRKKKREKKEWEPPQITPITPITDNQRLTFEAFDRGQNLVLHGLAGSGKSFISMYLGLKDVLQKKRHDTLMLIRSIVPSRDIGFLPGSIAEKTAIYEQPYIAICEELVGQKNAYVDLKNHNHIEFATTSYIRGLTFRNSVVVIDEIQNMSSMELHTVMTRIGPNCQIILAGDFAQSDYMREQSGFAEIIAITKQMKSFTSINFRIEDIVRSPFVKEYIIAREKVLSNS